MKTSGPTDGRASAWSSRLLADFLFTIRSLGKARGYSATVLFTLVMGISVSAIVYHVAGWAVSRKSPFSHPEQLFMAGSNDGGPEVNYWRPGLILEAYREQAGGVGRFVASGTEPENIVLDGEPIPVVAAGISVDAFDVLGIKPVLGRGFLPGEEKEGAEGGVIVSDAFWKMYLGGTPDALGRRLKFGQQSCTVVGILGPGIYYPYVGGEIYRPLVLRADPRYPYDQGLFIVTRLKPGVTPQQAAAVLSTVRFEKVPAWAKSYFERQKAVLTNLGSLGQNATWWVILAAGALLYAISCLNTVNLMLIRLIGRRRELSIRSAIGASRIQMLQILLVECALLCAAACVLSAILVHGSMPLVHRALYANDSLYQTAFWNWGELRFIAELGGLTCALTAIVPAVRVWRINAGTGLKDGGSASGESRGATGVRTVLVVLQAAFAVMLLTGAGLMVRTFYRMERIDLGFDPAGKINIQIALPSAYARDMKAESKLQLFQRLQENLGRLPGVRAVSYSEGGLMRGGWMESNLRMGDGTMRKTNANCVAPNFQEAAGLRMLEGRWLSSSRSASEVVINETLAKERFGSQSPVGRLLEVDLDAGKDPKPYSVVGVVADVRPGIRQTADARIYFPPWLAPGTIDTLVLRLDRQPASDFARLVRRSVYLAEPRLYIFAILSIDEGIKDETWAERHAYTMLKGLAAVALVLTAVGLFSVISVMVDSRMQEFGVRMAVGATSGDLRRMVIRRGLVAALLGILIGIGGAIALTRFMRSLLFETEAFDPAVFVAVAAVLLVVSVLACLLPARRAARVDVLQLLRSN